MAWNGSGTYSRPVTTVSPATGGTTIDVADQNTYTADVAAGVNACLAKNGENAATANLQMGGFKHTGAADGVDADDYATVGQISDLTEAILGTSDEFDYTNTAGDSMTASTWTQVNWAGANYKLANESGMYQCNVNLSLDSTDDGSFLAVAIYIDPLAAGSPAVSKIGPLVQNNTGGASDLRTGISTIISVNATDRIYVYAYHDSALAKTLTVTAAPSTLCWFNGFRVLGTS